MTGYEPSKDGMNVTVTGVEPFGTFDTVIVFRGVTEDGDEVRFGVDHRPARDLREALADEGRDEIVAYVEDWQIIGRSRA